MDSLSICRIIRESARCGVSELKIGDLKITFQLGSERKLELPKNTYELPLASQPETNISQQEIPLAPRVELTDEQKAAFEAFQEAQMLIEDPIGYEESIVDEHLEGYRVRGNGDRVDGTFTRGSQ